jgi:8-oxo-dGTP pyrophosphatase MutT (NUDIX family)
VSPVRAWLARARAAAEVALPASRSPIRIEGRPSAVGSIEPGLAERLAAAGLPLRRAADAWVVEAPVDASLATIARWLHREGHCSHWRDEALAVCDDDGRACAVVERSVARALGIATAAAHLVGTTPAGHVWVQQRAFDKAVDPGAWDTLVGGLVAAGETVRGALARETREEAGLELDALGALRCVASTRVLRPVADGWMDEAIAIFHAVVPAGREPVNGDGEVERFECLPPGVLLDRLDAGAFTLEATLIHGLLLEQGVIRTPG